MSSLFPPGIYSLADLPHHLHDAIVLALQMLSFEELPSDERPRRAIWLQPEKLREHFAAVEKRREEKWGTPGQDKTIDDPVENDAAKALLVG